MYYGENVIFENLIRTDKTDASKSDNEILNEPNKNEVLEAIVRMAKILETQVRKDSKWTMGTAVAGEDRADLSASEPTEVPAASAHDFRLVANEQPLLFVNASAKAGDVITAPTSSTDYHHMLIKSSDNRNIMSVKDDGISIDGTLKINNSSIVTEDRLSAVLEEIKSVIKENELLKKFSKALMERSDAPTEVQ